MKLETFTHCRTETSLQSTNTFITPSLSEDIDGIVVNSDASSTFEFTLKLQASFGHFGRVRHCNLRKIQPDI